MISIEKSIRSDAKFLIIDDQLSNIELLERILRRAGYKHIIKTLYPRAFIELYQECQPDIILMDLHMPEIDGFDLLEALEPLIPKSAFMPVLMLTADITPQAKRQALLAGAKDFLTKPFDNTEVLLRIHNLLHTRFLNLEVQQNNLVLEEKVRHRTQELEQAQIAILECLARATEFRDDATGEHTKRVGELSANLALALGMSSDESETIRLASLLHDIGKIGIRDDILLKPGKLTSDEYDNMKSHTLIGKEIISTTRFPVLNMAQIIAYSHHERWDGTGYPSGLKEEEIPIVGQIVAIADVFDALTHTRPYKPAWTTEEALIELNKQSGKHFNPYIVTAFVKVIEEMERSASYTLKEG